MLSFYEKLKQTAKLKHKAVKRLLIFPQNGAYTGIKNVLSPVFMNNSVMVIARLYIRETFLK
jgi:hypothetical protein